MNVRKKPNDTYVMLELSEPSSTAIQPVSPERTSSRERRNDSVEPEDLFEDIDDRNAQIRTTKDVLCGSSAGSFPAQNYDGCFSANLQPETLISVEVRKERYIYHSVKKVSVLRVSKLLLAEYGA